MKPKKSKLFNVSNFVIAFAVSFSLIDASLYRNGYRLITNLMTRRYKQLKFNALALRYDLLEFFALLVMECCYSL